MGFFNDLFSRKKDDQKSKSEISTVQKKKTPLIVRHDYFGGYDLPVSDMEGFLFVQGVEETNVPRLTDVIVFSYDESNLLADINLYSNKLIDNQWRGGREKEISSLVGKLEGKENPKHVIIDLIKNPKGLHQIGGKKPIDFVLPATNTIGSFQYLGFINNDDKHFNWLGIKLHLICPIFLNFNKLFIDYSNPLEPSIINNNELIGCTTSYDFLNPDFHIHYKPYKCRYEGAFDYGYGIGHSGIPNWIQHPFYPRCPKTNRLMKFVCQLKSNTAIMVEETNVQTKDKYVMGAFKKLNFWSDGNLFVYYEPASRVACYFIQNT